MGVEGDQARRSGGAHKLSFIHSQREYGKVTGKVTGNGIDTEWGRCEIRLSGT